jgi:hypothetical protein
VITSPSEDAPKRNRKRRTNFKQHTLPPIATLSPTSTSPSPAHEPERMSIDRTQPRLASPQAQSVPRGKFVEVMNPARNVVRFVKNSF